MTNGNDVTQNIKHTNLFNKTKIIPFPVPPDNAPASVCVGNGNTSMTNKEIKYCKVLQFPNQSFSPTPCGRFPTWKKPEKMFSGGKGGRGPPIVVHD